MADAAKVQIVGPFHEHRLVVDGWRVPLLNAKELDGGKFLFTLDGRFGLEVDTEHFDRVAAFLANAIAVALGLPCHPSGELKGEDLKAMWALLPHRALAPSKVTEITAVNTSDRRRAHG